MPPIYARAYPQSLFAPEEESGAGGGASSEKTFTQADLDRIVQERVGKLKDQLKALGEQASRVSEIEKKLAEADAREQAAREEAELKGKSELEKLQHQLQKASEGRKSAESEWARKLAELETGKVQAEQRFVDHVKTNAVKDALRAAGLVAGADKAASLAFLTEAQIELGADMSFTSIAVAGKSFTSPVDAAKEFLAQNPYFAAAPQGGSGSPRSVGGGAPKIDMATASAEEAFAIGLATPPRPTH